MFKNRIIVEAVLAGKSQSQVAKQYGISQPRVSQLMVRWRHGGWPALEKQSRRPHSNPKTTPPAVTARILQLRVQLAEQGCDNGAQSIAHALAGELLAAGTKVIDLSADFRLQDADEWAKWYGQPHGAPELLADAVYGLPEVNREQIRQARLIAVPGCYPTATQLGFLPLLEAAFGQLRVGWGRAKRGLKA